MVSIIGIYDHIYGPFGARNRPARAWRSDVGRRQLDDSSSQRQLSSCLRSEHVPVEFLEQPFERFLIWRAQHDNAGTQFGWEAPFVAKVVIECDQRAAQVARA